MTPWIALLLSAAASSSDARIRAALTAEQAGNDAGAIHELEAVVAQHPSEPVPRVELARLRLKQGRELDRAAHDLDVARALAPENPRVHFLLGVLSQDRGDPVEATHSLEQAVLFRPDYAEARHRVAGLYFSRGMWPQAEQHYRALAQLKRDDPGPTLQLATVLERQGQGELAERVLLAFLQTHPRSPPVRLRLAELYERTGRPKQAEVMRAATGRGKRKLRQLKPSRR